MAHTPAPWKWINQPYEDGDPYITVKAGPCDTGFNFQGIFPEEDAKLICAAPSLLAACKSAMEFLSNGTAIHPGSLVGGEIEAAIRQAENS